ncbi:MAG: hypothetical protein KAY38_05525 [Acinetobacter sp.]|nr:hypothetical protein [Acinetobacter sp.]
MFNHFDLKELQKRHPEAFFQPLHFAQLKFPFYHSVHVINLAIIFLTAMSTVMLCLGFAILISDNFRFDILQALTLSTVLFAFIQFPFQFWVQQQAKHSSKFYAQRLQNSLYIQILIIILFVLNYFILDIPHLYFPSLVLFSFFGYIVIFIEPLYKYNTPRLEIVRLHKIRQMAFWAFQQTKNNSTQQTYYYLNLYNKCMLEEQKLSKQILYPNFISAIITLLKK